MLHEFLDRLMRMWEFDVAQSMKMLVGVNKVKEVRLALAFVSFVLSKFEKHGLILSLQFLFHTKRNLHYRCGYHWLMVKLKAALG